MTEYRNRSRPQARKMTRAHFEAIAETLKDVGAGRTGVEAIEYMGHEWIRRDALVKAFAAMCAASNGGFDRERFYRACGLEE